MSTPRSRSAGMTEQIIRPTERNSGQGTTKILAPRSINRDGGTQIRGAIDEATLAEYTEHWTRGAKFPPPVVFFDGTVHWLADGFHRVLAAIRAKIAEIEVQVMEGGRREAILHAVGANAAHGLRRSNADKERAVRTLLDDPEWTKWSDREIGHHCRVDHKTVGRIRKGDVLGNSPDTRRTAIRNGKKIEIETGRINGGRKAAAKAEPGGAEAIAAEAAGLSRLNPVPVADPLPPVFASPVAALLPPAGWLESLLLRPKLADPTLFDLNATIYYVNQVLLGPIRSFAPDDPQLKRARRYIPISLIDLTRSLAHPDEWQLCLFCNGRAKTKHGNTPCPDCDGQGFQITQIEYSCPKKRKKPSKMGNIMDFPMG